MNSWRSIVLSAWAPPLITFIIGTGRTCALGPPMYRHKGRSRASAAARAVARLTPSTALAPTRDLLGVPSRSRRAVSISRCSRASMPRRVVAISPFTNPTAASTPLPLNRRPPSRSSTASCSPVLAPDGTRARPRAPLASSTSASTVGLPRESRTSRPRTTTMSVAASDMSTN